MRTSTAVASLAIVAAAAPALALPVSSPIVAREPDEEINARAVSLGALGKDLGKGLLTGGAFAGLGELVGGGGSGSSAAAPAPTKRALSIDDIEAELAKRGVSFGTLGKELGKGLLTGGAFAGLGELVGGGDSSSAAAPAPTKRALSIDDIEAELAKRGVSFGTLGKELGKGLLTGGAFAGLGELVGGGDSSSAAAPAPTKRALSDELELLKRGGLGSIIGKLAGATDDSIGTVIKNGIAGGAATGAAISAGNAVLGNNKRELDHIVDEFLAKRGVGSVIGKLAGATEDDIGTVIKNAIAGGAATGAAVSAGDAVLGNNNKREIDDLVEVLKRDLLERSLVSSAGKLLEGGAGDAIKKGLVNGVGAAVGGTAIGELLNATRRDIDERSLLSSAGKVLEGGAGDAIKKGLVNGLGAAVGGTVIGDVLNATRRDLNERSLASSAGKLVEGGVGDAIKKGLVNGLGAAVGGTAIGAALDATKREPEPLSAIGKGLLGTGVGIAASTGVQQAVDGVESLFNRELSSDEQDQLKSLLARHLNSRAPEPLGSIGKGLIGTGVGIAASSLAQDAIGGVESLFNRSVSLDELD